MELHTLPLSALLETYEEIPAELICDTVRGKLSECHDVSDKRCEVQSDIEFTHILKYQAFGGLGLFGCSLFTSFNGAFVFHMTVNPDDMP